MKYLIGFLLAILLIDSFYLVFLSKSLSFCPYGGKCSVVLNSVYNKLFSIPLSLLGLFYVMFLLFSFAGLIIKKNWHYLILLNLALAGGSLLSLYFIFLQAFILKAFCFFCLTFETTTILLTLFWFLTASHQRSNTI
ncbi:hypothetical protein M1525_00580 [Patescibacteria group bacterium]|nr:hypothetical protein [Patescibacteria group bacterium]